MIAASRPSGTGTSTTPAVRSGGLQRWLSLLSGMLVARSSMEWVQAPQALACEPSVRARRLMRNARCGGW